MKNYIKTVGNFAIRKEWINVALPIHWILGLKIPNDLNDLSRRAFLFFTFFPYIYLFPIIRSDIQPYAFMLSVMLAVAWYPKKVPSTLTWFIGAFFVASMVLFMDSIGLDAVRNYLGYFSILFQTYAGYRYIQKYGMPYKAIYVFILIWFGVGLIQQFDPDFLHFLLRRGKSGGGGRGVSALSAEPTFYGIVATFLGFIAYVCHHEKRKLLIILCIIQVVLFAKSSMVLVYLMLLVGLIVLFKSTWRQLLGLSFVGIVGLLILFNVSTMLTQIRFFGILNRLFSGGFVILIRKDESINDRIAHIYFSVKGFIEDGFVPHGYVSFKAYLEEELPKQELFWWVNESNKILSAYGATIYELGLFGLMIPIGITHMIWVGLKESWRNRVIMILFIHAFLFSGIPITMPLLAFFCSILIVRASNHEGTLST